MKKICENCGNYTAFYTKFGIRYCKTTCGRCWAHKAITGHNETCELWDNKIVINDHEQENLTQALDTVITHLNDIKHNLTEE